MNTLKTDLSDLGGEGVLFHYAFSCFSSSDIFFIVFQCGSVVLFMVAFF